MNNNLITPFERNPDPEQQFVAGNRGASRRRMLLGSYVIKQQGESGEIREVLVTVPDEEF